MVSSLSPYRALFHAIQSIEKVELHSHLYGSFPMKTIEEMATKKQRERIQSICQRMQQERRYAIAFELFPLVSEVVDTYQKLQEATYSMLQEQIQERVVYLEIRTGVKELKDNCTSMTGKGKRQI